MPPPTVEGDIEGAVALGLANGREDLVGLTHMLTSAIPDGVACTATWTRAGPDSYCMSIDQAEFKQHLTFHRQDDGFEVEFGLLVISRRERRRGYTKRLIRNLTHAFSRLGVRYVRTHANDEDGAIAWAKLGARPDDADRERAALLTRLDAEHARLGIAEVYVEGMAEVIMNAPDALLMRSVAAMVGEAGEPLGERLLKHHGWAAHWDLHDPELQSWLREKVG